MDENKTEMTREQFYLKAKIEHENRTKSWSDLMYEYIQLFDEKITVDAIRKRVKRIANKKGIPSIPLNTKQNNNVKGSNDYKQFDKDGSINATKTVIDDVTKFEGDREAMLNYLGYNADEWELITWRISQWDGGVGGAPRYSIQYKVKPREELNAEDFVKVAQKVFKSKLTPFHSTCECESMCDCQTAVKQTRLMEIPPIELHFGKIGDTIQTGEEYNTEIAKKRFYEIFNAIISKQQRERCDTCLIVVGGDFFNSEADNCTSVHKIPQQNTNGWLKLFSEGLKMYTEFILGLKEHFHYVDVMVCPGNHARHLETLLYVALQQYFREDRKVTFSDDLKETQCYSFGQCAIFYNHGDAKLQQIIKSIPAEFYKDWGNHKFRELHLGHLHKEVTVDDEGGMITRRVGSPCGSDAWHASNRWVGAVKKHEIFIWHAEYGLEDVYYINTRV